MSEPRTRKKYAANGLIVGRVLRHVADDVYEVERWTDAFVNFPRDGFSARALVMSFVLGATVASMFWLWS